MDKLSITILILIVLSIILITDYKYYDCIISINVHEKFHFLLDQLKNINNNVTMSYAVILNCNDYMYAECNINKHKLSSNIYINNKILNKKVYHGSLFNGIYNNMVYALYNFRFKYFIIASSRSIFGNNIKLKDLNRISRIKQEILVNNYNEWWWPNFLKTKLAKYYLNQNKNLYKSAHEGLLLTKKCCEKIVNFLDYNKDIKNELFNFEGCVEEFAFQTIAINSNEIFYYIGNGCCKNEKSNPINNEFMYKIIR
jgi:hypothetical protein